MNEHQTRSFPLAILIAILMILSICCLSPSAHALPYTPPGDTLTVIMKPLLNLPTIIPRGDTLEIDCVAPISTTDWDAVLGYRSVDVPLTMVSAEYVASLERWKLKGIVPSDTPVELYDLTVTASGGLSDVTENAIHVIDSFDSSFYFVHVTDTHLPTHLYYYETGSETDSSELVDFREVIKDINIINPAFVVVTGDLINEGELEDFEYRRYFTRAQRLLTELEVPMYLLTGNHDVGGWDDTPPPDGEARRTWWRFFGWPYLNDPPVGDPAYTQDYSFDYGACHIVGLEAYINYDMWRPEIYGSQSYRPEQLTWLSNNLAAASGSSLQILFHHYDFSSQLNLSSLGIDLSLYGHIHSDKGSLTGWPLNIATKSCCDGNRAYRLVRVNGTTITPTATVSAGSSGTNLRIAFSSPNDGTVTDNSATITNGLAQGFEHGLVRFYMDAVDGISFSVTNGTLLQTVRTDSVIVCHVGVNIPSASSVTVYIESLIGVGEERIPALMAMSCFPNPLEAATNIRFSLSENALVMLSIFDTKGRLVKRLVNAQLGPGLHTFGWNGTDAGSNPVAPGIYVYRLDVAGQSFSKKLLVIR